MEVVSAQDLRLLGTLLVANPTRQELSRDSYPNGLGIWISPLAFPREPPPEPMMDPASAAQARDSGPNGKYLRRANQWAAALETHSLRQGSYWTGERGGLAFGGRRVVCTTYGFARVTGQVRLSVIHYVRPMQAFTHTSCSGRCRGQSNWRAGRFPWSCGHGFTMNTAAPRGSTPTAG